MLTNLTDNIFDNAIKTGLVLIVWLTEWHAPSLALGNRVSKIATKAKVFGIDVDQEIELAMRFSVRGVPTLMLFQDGQLITRETSLTADLEKQI